MTRADKHMSSFGRSLPRLHRGASLCLFASILSYEASLFEAATSAQKSKGRGSSKKSSKKKVSKGVKKEVKPFPDKAGDSFLPAQGACALAQIREATWCLSFFKSGAN